MKNLALGFVSMLLVPAGVAAVEFGLRLQPVANAEPASFESLHTHSDVYGWELRKGLRTADDRRVTTINAQGYRDAALPLAKGKALRVVLLGDSIAFGLAVDDGDTFARVLDDRRNDIEVANLAVQGYDPGQELIKLEREGFALHPDVVVLALCVGNDFADAALPVFLYDGRHSKPYFTVDDDRLVVHRDEQLRLSIRERLGLFLKENSRLYPLLAAQAPSQEARDEPVHWTARKRRALRDRDGVVDLVAHLVRRMSDECRRENVEFIVAAFPDRPAYRQGSPWLDQLSASPVLRGVNLVDMAERFHARGIAFDDIALDGIGHLNPRGHRVTAEILERVLTEQGLTRAKTASSGTLSSY